MSHKVFLDPCLHLSKVETLEGTYRALPYTIVCGSHGGRAHFAAMKGDRGGTGGDVDNAVCNKILMQSKHVQGIGTESCNLRALDTYEGHGSP